MNDNKTVAIDDAITKCWGIGCEVRLTCRRYLVPYGAASAWRAIYEDDSFRPVSGCDYYMPDRWSTVMGTVGLIAADFNKARE